MEVSDKFLCVFNKLISLIKRVKQGRMACITQRRAMELSKLAACLEAMVLTSTEADGAGHGSTEQVLGLPDRIRRAPVLEEACVAQFKEAYLSIGTSRRNSIY